MPLAVSVMGPSLQAHLAITQRLALALCLVAGCYVVVAVDQEGADFAI